MNFLKIACVISALCLVSCLAVGNHSECSGEHQYFDAEDQVCKECEKCLAGYQPREYCGYGTKSTHYGCEKCPPNTFSNGENYLRCIACIPCNLLNSAVSLECTPTTNRICGICHAGFYRPLKSDGTRDTECHKCSDATSNLPECQVDNSSTLIIGVTVGVALVVIVALCFIILSQNKLKNALNRKKQRSPEKPCDCNARTSYDGNLTDSRSGGILTNHGQAELQLVDEIQAENIYRQRITEEENPLLKSEVNRNKFDSAFQSGGTSLNSDYPNMPTAEYQETHAPSHVGDPSMTYSNTPTKSFETNDCVQPGETGVRPQLPNLACRHGSCSSRVPRRKTKPGQTSSCESLLSGSQGDRESYGERRNSHPFVDPMNLSVESFDFSDQAEQKNM